MRDFAQQGYHFILIPSDYHCPIRRFQLHAMTMENGVAKMRDLSGIDIKPGQTLEFKPGGSHVMFVNLKRPLSKGEHISGTLVFECVGKVNVEYSVESIGAQTGPQEMEHMQH
jgi:copper(I)-binding protein